MAANIFGRYVWLIEQFRRYGRLTYEEVNNPKNIALYLLMNNM